MNGSARAELISALEHMQVHGSSMSMLIMTVRGTSNGLMAGVSGGQLTVDYPRAGWLDFVRVRRFASFCRNHRYPLMKEKWGKERVSRALIGTVVEGAADAIDRCFLDVYEESGPFGLELRVYDWQPSNNALERARGR